MIKLVEMAKEAAKKSYAPYSGFNVGAALLTKSGKVYTGCNIENSAFSPSVCAERTAIFKAVSDGEMKFDAIAIVGGAGCDFKDYTPPCGVCRQVMLEFCDSDFKVVLGKNGEEYKTYTLAELVPVGFSFEKE